MGARGARRSVRRTVAMVALAAGIGAGSLTVGTAVVEAHQPGTNGCTLSPDIGYVPVYYNFHNACDTHDLCYGGHLLGDGEAGRKACDDQFRSNMRAWCNAYYSAWWAAAARSACRGVADTYYSAVRLFGGAFF